MHIKVLLAVPALAFTLVACTNGDSKCGDPHASAERHSSAAAQASRRLTDVTSERESLQPKYDEWNRKQNLRSQNCNGGTPGDTIAQCLVRFEARYGFTETPEFPSDIAALDKEKVELKQTADDEQSTAAQIIVNNPDCFTADEVVQAQNGLPGDY